ncbi:zeta toxin family protein [Microbacterium sp. LRZ72]|uniref:zeta toxin family protein n=1 Tax=Microbacterium sp. LRZ72 TaxID=2942481 RepID=UPI0029A6D725|nr:zeta toxin family protein [Microbacterium sp. LRZ72]MDX2377777.1 zeta toxin family protein [Microbacterium sp. LRZ72]
MPSDEIDRIFDRDIRPLVFADAEEIEPELVILSGQPGSGRAQAISRIQAAAQHRLDVVSGDELRAFHPRYTDLAGTADGEGELATAAAQWVGACIAYARDHRRSVLLKGSFENPDAVTGTLRLFAGHGFRTRVFIVGVPARESLLTLASTHLSRIQAGRASQFTDAQEHQAGFRATRAVATAVETSAPDSRLVVLDRRGSTVFDSETPVPDQGGSGVEALLDAQSATPSTMDTVEWLGELRRVSEFAQSLRRPDREVLEALVELHELALREVTPHLPSFEGSDVLAVQKRSIATRLVELRRTSAPTETVDAAGPVVGPAGPDRGGVSR